MSPEEALECATPEESPATKIFGAPAVLEMKHQFVGALPTDQFEPLIARIRELMHDPGVVDRTDSSFTWSSTPNQHALQSELMIVIRVDGLQTILLATDRLDGLIVRSFGKVGGLLVTGGLVAPVAASVVIPTLAPAFLVGWIGGVYGAMRTLYRRLVGGRANKLRTVFDEMVREIQPVVA